MAEDSDLEKTEQASPKRLEKARENGDIPRSRELATCAVLFTSGLGLWMLGGQLVEALRTTLKTGLQLERAEVYDPMLLLMQISKSINYLLWTFTPFACLLVFVGLASPIMVGGWNFTPNSIVPKFSKLNPMKGLMNLVSKNSGVELLKSIAKTVLVGVVAYQVIAGDMGSILSLSQQPLPDGIGQIANMMLTGFLAIASVLVFIAAIDVPYQLYQYAEKHKMTKQEVKDESKESEGNPEIKGRIRQQQREMARRRMMAEIPKADVVITNPTHYAVAIQYKEDGMRAPVVIAKGTDVIALKIREIAAEHQVPTLESPKLARAIYAHTEIGDEIPAALYSAVAEVLAYVFQMRVFKKEGGFRPEVPKSVPVPDELDPHSLINTLVTNNVSPEATA